MKRQEIFEKVKSHLYTGYGLCLSRDPNRFGEGAVTEEAHLSIDLGLTEEELPGVISHVEGLVGITEGLPPESAYETVGELVDYAFESQPTELYMTEKNEPKRLDDGFAVIGGGDLPRHQDEE